MISPSASRASLAESGFECPEWNALVEGLRPNQPVRAEVDPADHTHGWQFFAVQRVEHHFRAETAQSGPMSGVAFSAVPSSPPTRLAPQLFRVLLLRRLWLPLPLTSRTCRCGRFLVATNVQRVREPGCWAVGDFSVESAAARVCLEAGARVSTNLFVRDLDLPVAPHDARRLEVVADGQPLFGEAQFIDTTLVSPVRADGEPRGQCARQDGAALAEAHRLKDRTYPELSGSQGRARLVVLAAEVGGRWSEDARSFVSQLARAKVRSFPRVLRGRARQAWQYRWSDILSCATARAFALSLLDRRAALGSTVSDAVAACRHLPDLS